MFPLLINPIPLILTLSTAFGVLVHDTQIDKATATAMTMPITIVAYGAADIALKLNDPHVHSERAPLSEGVRDLKASQPRVQPRNGDDKKYVTQKKSSVTSFGSEYSWPSI